ncbi:uncharacterized protein LOC143250368 [Tachypleus tridentatus]|uniref:uncharacterized protein LOC143250368 n=1 Tax=Tachypleus tridentatus TaxID=6853 RepID=UPI003FD1FB8D
MPRGRGKKSQSPKVKVEKSSSQIPEVAIEIQPEKSPRRSSRCSTRSQVSPGSEPISEGRRSRRSSTAAQTAASEAHARVTRSRSHKESPTSTPKSEAESPATRVRSGCRNKSRVNYQEESEGEEDTTTVKKEIMIKITMNLTQKKKLARSGNKRATSRSQKNTKKK